ncbi:MAG TPA: hypothetical protein LFV91_01200 [Rickettsia endosymbiont of Bembidion nr. Transversale]|nr:hypothetical protein [Rickettsia endosymbiont of Bembidion nr. Transversale]
MKREKSSFLYLHSLLDLVPKPRDDRSNKPYTRE